MSDEQLEYGIVKTYDHFKGYGFIQRTRGKDVFVFYEDLVDSDIALTEGMRVGFLIRTTPKGPRAIQVKILG